MPLARERASEFRRAMGVARPGVTIGKLVSKAALIEDPALVEMMSGAFRRPPPARRPGKRALEGSWSVQTINTINKHFSLAMLDCHVKHVAAQCEYLQLPASITTETGADSGWLGFPARFATGLSWQFKS